MKAIGACWDCVAGWDGTGCATGHSSVKKSVSASCMRRIVNPGGRIYAFRVYANGLMKCGLGPFDLSTSWRLMPVVAGRTILSERFCHSIRSFALAASIVCHCMFAGTSGPLRLRRTT